MTYTEAVQLAIEGNERGFGFLYQNTYKSKLYLALQYMKNESDAEDVLQDAYVKAFSNLKDLKDPEKFSSWLGQIVANTAKNALVKKNPALFTDMGSDEEEGESFEEQIPDEDVSNQPELSYTREETRQMVDELIDSLSDEQRVCILMYHMEDMPIKEIAETLDCSESTVKSRLNYGRKNLKAKVEEMQKKGYKLYSIAPLVLLPLLLHNDAEAMYSEPAFTAAGRQISSEVFDQIPSLPEGEMPGKQSSTEETRPEEHTGTEDAAAEEEELTGETIEEAAGEEAGEAGEAGETAEAEATGETVGAEEAGETAEAGESTAQGTIEDELNTAAETGTTETGTAEEAGADISARLDTAGKSGAGTATEAGGSAAGTTAAGTGATASGAGTAASGTGAASSGTGAAATGATSAGTGAGAGAGAGVAGTGAASSGADATTAGAGATSAGAGAGAGAAAKSGVGAWLINTTIGNVIIGGGVVIIAIGAIFGVSGVVRNVAQPKTVVEEAPVGEPEEAAPEVQETRPETEETEETGEQEEEQAQMVTAEMYPDLLEGGMTQSQFEELLGYVPVGMTNGQVSKSEVSGILSNLAFDSFFRFSDNPEKLIGVEGSFREQRSETQSDVNGYFDFNLEQMNNYLSVLLVEPLTNDNLQKSDISEYNDYISGNTLSVVSLDGDYGLSQQASITGAIQSGDTMIINFSVTLYNSVDYTYEDRYAILKQRDGKKFRIDTVSIGTVDLTEAAKDSDVYGSLKDLYVRLLKDIQGEKYRYEFETQEEDFIVDTVVFYGYRYFLTDMNGDGVQDLVVAKVYCPNTGIGTGIFDWYDTRVFVAEQKNGEWGIDLINDEVEMIGTFTDPGHDGFLALVDYSRGLHEGDYRWISVSSDTFDRGDFLSEPEGDSVDWFEVSDLSGLDELE